MKALLDKMLQPQFLKVVCKKLYPFVAVPSKMHAPHLQSMLLDKLKINLLEMSRLEEYLWKHEKKRRPDVHCKMEKPIFFGLFLIHLLVHWSNRNIYDIFLQVEYL